MPEDTQLFMCDTMGKIIPVAIRSYYSLGIAVKGYGWNKAGDDYQALVVLAFNSANKLCLYVWADVNNGGAPTHVISLEGAKENRREKIKD